MAIFSLSDPEIQLKIVYYGPGRCGKTTSLNYIFNNYKKQISGEMVSIDTEGDRTLFFDYLPMDLGKIKGRDLRVQLFTVPGQVQYNSTRKLVLKGADGVVFVADSLEVRREKNMMALRNLQVNLKEDGKNIYEVPLVMHYNKRDLEIEGMPVMPVERMDRDLNRQLKVPVFSGSAVTGEGVGKALKMCLKLTLKSVYDRLNAPK